MKTLAFHLLWQPKKGWNSGLDLENMCYTSLNGTKILEAPTSTSFWGLLSHMQPMVLVFVNPYITGWWIGQGQMLGFIFQHHGLHMRMVLFIILQKGWSSLGDLGICSTTPSLCDLRYPAESHSIIQNCLKLGCPYFGLMNCQRFSVFLHQNCFFFFWGFETNAHDDNTVDYISHLSQ